MMRLVAAMTTSSTAASCHQLHGASTTPGLRLGLVPRAETPECHRQQRHCADRSTTTTHCSVCIVIRHRLFEQTMLTAATAEDSIDATAQDAEIPRPDTAWRTTSPHNSNQLRCALHAGGQYQRVPSVGKLGEVDHSAVTTSHRWSVHDLRCAVPRNGPSVFPVGNRRSK